MLGTTILLAFREIRRHLMRSFLTVLGVVIGVFSVITMVTLGNGATASVRQSISALGSDMLQVRPGQSLGPGGGGAAVAPPFKLDDLAAIHSQIAGVVAVAGQAQVAATAVRNAQNWSTSVTGTSNDFFTAQKLAFSAGRRFTPAEEQSGRSVCVIGSTIARNLFQGVDPVGQSMRVRNISCEVVGVLAERGQSGFAGDQDDTVVMPIKAVQRRMTGNHDVRAIIVGVDPAFDSSAIKASLVALMRERRRLAPTEADDFSVLDSRQISDTIASTVGLLTVLVGAVAGISLLVGGIGIMNIMLVSVTERTREIGVRLAIGALGHEVLLQFLVEAVVLSCLGGLIGIALALVTCLIVAPLMGLPFLFDPAINLLSFAFSALIGVVFGYFPARRAAALNPIEALRYD
ncbi:ABC transporter permease [Novosphingobium sp. NDB2Meth1]|uniref:ABC transporter permease n=1 Tax=Novosphingobium sp. NDB2Meth1 TaxID=1892847 RepID=UPI0009314CCB|nr:ABC transporter permease [Novosphingobium sp. NDB2Meth1]